MTSELMKRFLVRAHQPSAGAAPSRLPIAWRLSAAPAPRGKRRTGALPQQSLVQARIFTGRAWKPIARLSRDLRARELNCVRVAGDLLRDASWDSLRRPGIPWAASVTFFKTRTLRNDFYPDLPKYEAAQSALAPARPYLLAAVPHHRYLRAGARAVANQRVGGLIIQKTRPTTAHASAVAGRKR